MGWVDDLRGHTVGLDTAPLIYFIERHPSYVIKLRSFFQAAERGEFRIVTSIVTLAEVLVHPLRNGRRDLVLAYRDVLLQSPNLSAVNMDPTIAEEAAQVRARYRIATPDAIQLATAKLAKARWFLTNDASLPHLPELEVLLVDQLPVE